ncbi:conserved hypothetical protein [Gammaproteobacteria bacterium]
MKVKLLQLMAGPMGVFPAGQHDLPEELVRALVAGGYAEADVGPQKPIFETATLAPVPETADLPKKRGRRK